MIDALAARSTKRLNCTIQITDTGINPAPGIESQEWSESGDAWGSGRCHWGSGQL